MHLVPNICLLAKTVITLTPPIWHHSSGTAPTIWTSQSLVFCHSSNCPPQQKANHQKVAPDSVVNAKYTEIYLAALSLISLVWTCLARAQMRRNTCFSTKRSHRREFNPGSHLMMSRSHFSSRLLPLSVMNSGIGCALCWFWIHLQDHHFGSIWVYSELWQALNWPLKALYKPYIIDNYRRWNDLYKG